MTTAMSVALESVGASNLPSRSDFVTMKEDLAFREGEVAKSKQTLEGLSAEHTQLKVIKYYKDGFQLENLTTLFRLFLSQKMRGFVLNFQLEEKILEPFRLSLYFCRIKNQKERASTKSINYLI